MDNIAGEIGVRPSLPWLFFTDYPLFKRVLWGPVTAYQYRLMGPGKWKGARRAVFTQFDRMFQALKTRQVWNEFFFVHFLFANIPLAFQIKHTVISHIIWTLTTVSITQTIKPNVRLIIHLFQLEEPEASTTGRLMKLSLTVMAGGAAVYYIHVRNPTALPNLISKLQPQIVWSGYICQMILRQLSNKQAK